MELNRTSRRKWKAKKMEMQNLQECMPKINENLIFTMFALMSSSIYYCQNLKFHDFSCLQTMHFSNSLQSKEEKLSILFYKICIFHEMVFLAFLVIFCIFDEGIFSKLLSPKMQNLIQNCQKSLLFMKKAWL